MELTSLQIWLDIISGLITSVGIVAGGAWALSNYIRNRVGKWNLNLSIHPVSIEYTRGDRLLNVCLNLENVGNTCVTPGTKGLVVTIRSIPDNIESGGAVDMDAGELIYRDDIIKKFKRENGKYSNYVIEPKSIYHEMALVVVPGKAFYSIRAEFFWKDNNDSLVEYYIVYAG